VTVKVVYHARLEVTDQFGNTKTYQNNDGAGHTVAAAAKESPEFGAQVNNTTVTLWDAAVGPQTDFRLIWLDTDVLVEVEFTVAGAPDPSFVVSLAPDAPIVIPADESFHTAVGGNLFNGTPGLINKVRAKEANSVEANVRMVLVR